MIKNKFAVIETGGKQSLIKSGDTIRIERIVKPKRGDTVHFDKVLLMGDEGGVKLGDPYIKGAKVSAKWLEEVKGKKITNLRYHSKTRYTKKHGHRQIYAKVAIREF